jgi:histone deacetylase 6
LFACYYLISLFLATGFCFVNSVVIAAKYALATKQASRVVILDWDIHDGNGTAESTIKDDNIFRIDLHRFNRREGFYPYTGPATEVGFGTAKGLNCNITWSQGGMRNTEYAAAFYELVLPLLTEYKPDLIIISCGLDAAMGDLLGGCELTPGFFHAMTRATIEAVGPTCPVVCALEGGYTMSVIPNCMEAVTLAMLNCPYSYHSSSSAFCGGAAVEKTVPWPTNPLKRSRKVLSKYYIRECSNMLLYSAVEDLNTCIKIFRGIDRWSHLPLKTIVGPVQKSRPKKRKVSSSTEGGGSGTSSYSDPTTYRFQRPRVYMWYGTEEWHHFNRFN